MPAKVTSQQTSGGGPSSRRIPSRTTSPPRNDESSSDGSTRRWLQKAATTDNRSYQGASSIPSPHHTNGIPGPGTSAVNKRSLSIRDQKVPQGPRPQEPSRRRNPSSTFLHSGNSSISSTNDSIHSNSSRFSYRSTNMGNQQNTDDDRASSGSADFLAPISFDDFHNSIMGDPALDQFPVPGNKETGSALRVTDFHPTNPWTHWRNDDGAARRARSGSFRQKDEFVRFPSHNPTSGAIPSIPAAASSTTRTRRQSLARDSTMNGSRKSIGPGSLPFSIASARRASLTARKASADATRTEQTSVHVRPRQHLEPNGRLESKSFASLRNLKAKSFQSPAKEHRENFLTTPRPEYSRSSSTDALQTPAKDASGQTPASSSSGRRFSIVPPRATGLGARTISPTDARRMKRLSMAPQAPPIPCTPTRTEPILPRPRSCAQSPCYIPRKSATPSSTRATPDPNRKSHNSGSLSSTPGHNVVRSAVLQSKLPQNISASRIPTPKPRVESTSVSGEEEVPPVPAIPKVYGSPKSGVEPSPNSTSHKESLPTDMDHVKPRLDSNFEASDEPLNVTIRRGIKTPTSSTVNKKNLQPLKLPPLNLLPLSTPMAIKIESLKERHTDELRSYTPTTQLVAKTPSTPLTASKANFFAIHNDDELPVPQARSSTSHFLPNSASTPVRALSSSSGLRSSDLSNTGAASPYSSSLPKNHSGEYNNLHRYPSGDHSQKSLQPSKLAGSRPQTQASALSPSAERLSQLSTSSETDTNSVSGVSLRNQISLTWTRRSSKAQTAAEANVSHARHSHAPPKTPSSGNLDSLSTIKQISPTPKLAYPRNKPVLCSSKNAAGEESTFLKEQTLSLRRTVSNEPAGLDRTPGRSASSILSPVHRIISSAKLSAGVSPRSSTQNIEDVDFLADEEMRRLNSKRKDFEDSARKLDELRRKAGPKERVSPAQALKMANLNIFERGEIIDFKDIYFCGTQSAKKHVGDLNAQSANFGYDDDRGDYNIVIGDHLAYRYEVLEVLGKGSFGQVVKCVDHKTGGLVAVKIIRNKKRFHQQALVEVNLLQKLKEWDPHNHHSVVNFTQSFYFRGHLCISTELLGINLYEFIKAHDFKGFSLNLIRRFTKQILSSLVLLRSKKVIHCDLKPENILLVHPMSSEIKVIDFGSSCFENEKVYTYIQSRFYRSPEVILGMSYGMPIDMWSLGCILAELYTGYPIFPGENEQEQLACIMEVFGPPEKHLIEKSSRKKLFFDSLGKPRITVSSKGRRRRPSSKDLKQALKCDNEPFLDFISRCLRWDPARRLNPIDAMNHEFITGIKAPPRPRHTSIKRINTMSTPSRPLPEPPGTNQKNSNVARGREVSGSTNTRTPHAKRHSTISGLPTSTPNQRTSNTTSNSRTVLPRVAARSISGKPDLGTASTTTSMVG